MDRIPWFGPMVGEAEGEAVRRVIQSGYLNDGPLVREFERELAAFLGVRHAIAVTSGTAAISLALLATGVQPGDEVIVPDLTFIATANAARMIGAVVRLVDVEADRFTICHRGVAEAIGPRTRAVVAVDVNGRAADYDALEPICARHGLALICDAAEALGSKHGGRFLGTFGQAGCFSFSANKTVTSGQGGMIVTDDGRLHNRLRELKDQGRRHGGTGGDDLHPVLGFNFKYTNLQAAVALEQFRDLPRRLDVIRHRDRIYREHLSGLPELSIPIAREASGEICQWFDILSLGRSEISDALSRRGIGTRAFWRPLHSQQCYAGQEHRFPASSSISSRGLWLASHLRITEAEIAEVCGVVFDALRPSRAGAAT